MILKISNAAAPARHPRPDYPHHATQTAHAIVQVATSIQSSIQFLTLASVLTLTSAVLCMFVIALYAHAKIHVRLGILDMTTYRPRRHKPRR